LNYLRILIKIKLAKNTNLLAHYAKGTAVILKQNFNRLYALNFKLF